MKPLLLPPTIRTARPNEVPQEDAILKRIAERANANIVEGYTLKPNPGTELPFVFSAEINIDNNRLWLLFKALMLQLPEEIACIYHHIDDEPTYGIYTDKFRVLNHLEQYKIEIAQDGFMEIGVIFNNEEFLEEAFVKRAKYLQYWGMDQYRFENTMRDFELYKLDDINFMDEYPLTTESLKMYNPAVHATDEFIDELDKLFAEEE
ncbi:hypothetical protein [Mucilaginibacter sp. FT3.2]|uniref:hypothetical protein n=1 Tax=Mucilaginibacter sp. FT3.2 TaxID=2723090 RepID=UPI00160B8541|nr:hypothetical protein [Mucilaginibacter sp. FT3.2]MBB6234616.1 hypothetical protein [Mucilaginibacter sp. FT3.2]